MVVLFPRCKLHTQQQKDEAWSKPFQGLSGPWPNLDSSVVPSSQLPEQIKKGRKISVTAFWLLISLK